MHCYCCLPQNCLFDFATNSIFFPEEVVSFIKSSMYHPFLSISSHTENRKPKENATRMNSKVVLTARIKSNLDTIKWIHYMQTILLAWKQGIWEWKGGKIKLGMVRGQKDHKPFSSSNLYIYKSYQPFFWGGAYYLVSFLISRCNF